MNRVQNPEAKSWIEVAPESHFPIQNLPFGLCEISEGEVFLGIPIGDFVFDVDAAIEEGILPGDSPCGYGWELDGVDACRELRAEVFDLLEASNPALRDNPEMREIVLKNRAQTKNVRPMHVGTFVDFYSSEYHASNVGKMFRPQGDALLPNWKHLPVGYNGRASTVVVSETPILRPHGQTKAPDAESPSFGPCKRLDFELEMGFFLGYENEWGHPIPVEDAEELMMGLVLVNDWSARDIQQWEYQPLGPFLAKSFATSISPWVVFLDALEPFRVDGPKQDPKPLQYLGSNKGGTFNIELEVWLQSAKMTKPQRICHTNFRHMYWSMAQQLAHQTSNGTQVQVGDLYASGTISGPDEGSYGSMLELCWKGDRPLKLEETGETRTFLEDGDILTLTGYAQGKGYRIGFGECSGQIEPALALEPA